MVNNVFYYVYWEHSWWELVEEPEWDRMEEQDKIKIGEKEVNKLLRCWPDRTCMYVGKYE